MTSLRTLRLIAERQKRLTQTYTDCDQCDAAAGQACHPNCPYIHQYGYIPRKETP